MFRILLVQKNLSAGLCEQEVHFYHLKKKKNQPDFEKCEHQSQSARLPTGSTQRLFWWWNLGPPLDREPSVSGSWALRSRSVLDTCSSRLLSLSFSPLCSAAASSHSLEQHSVQHSGRGSGQEERNPHHCPFCAGTHVVNLCLGSEFKLTLSHFQSAKTFFDVRCFDDFFSHRQQQPVDIFKLTTLKM